MRCIYPFAGILLSLAGILLAADSPATQPIGPAAATQRASVKTKELHSTLVINDADPAAQNAISLQEVTLRAVIAGPLAQTTITLTFKNSLNRILEGEFEFPLPESAAVSGYALDVPAGSGNLVDGVAVEKQRARQIFESEVRRGVDPGIVEQTRGNNFKTRLYPIPANGTRKVRLQYVSEIIASPTDSHYTVPLDFKQRITAAQIKIEVLNPEHPDKLKIEGLSSLAFTPAGPTCFIAEKAFSNIELTGALTVTLPAPAATTALVERRLRALLPENLAAADKRAEEFYTLISTTPGPPAAPVKPAKPQRIGLIWDTSLSRLSADKTAEKAFLQALAAKLGGTTQVDIIHLDQSGVPEAFIDGNADRIINEHLDKETYDGALRLDRFNATQKPRIAAYAVWKYDFYLLFSDGLVSLGEDHLAKTEVPVYTLCSDPRANHALLRSIATESGGMYFNLKSITAENAAAALLAPRTTVSLSGKPEEIAEIYPKGKIPATGQALHFAAKLLAREATLTLTTETAGQATTQQITVKQSSATDSRMVPRFWANQKVAALCASPGANADELTKIGREFNIVTPSTSLMVLETIDQYLRYRIVPPKTQPDLYKQFNEQIEQQNRQKQFEEAEKISHILALWEARRKWWEQKYEVPRDFVYKDKPGQNAQLIAAGQSGGSASLFTDPAAATTAARPVSTPPAAVPSAPGNTRSPESTIVPPTFNLSDITKGGTTSDGASRSSLFSDSGGRTLDEPQSASSASITLKAWSPDTPYLKAMAAVPAEKAYAVFLEQRKSNLASPGFYLDCANYLLEKNRTEEGIRVLTDIAQLRLESAPLLRIAAYRLLQIQQYDLAIDLFQKAKALRPDEPQSWRDLALATSEEALHRVWPESAPNFALHQRQLEDLLHAMDLYNHVIMNRWDRFDEIEVIALMEANALWAKIQLLPGYALVNKDHPLHNPLDPRLVKNLDCDIRIVLTWDADDTDIDLHVLEPTREEAFYAHALTTIGGLVSKDFTQGYGPEEYCLRHAPAGTYRIRAHYYGSSQQTLQGPVTVQATVFSNFGRENQKTETLTLRLTAQKEFVDVGEIKFTP